jgi:HEAT repeat protein
MTPDIGSPIVGGHLPVPSTHVHDDLHVRCLVLDDGKTRLALITCDVVGIHRNVCDAAKQQIEEQVGIPARNILISATHTHSAASVQGSDRLNTAADLDGYQKFVVRRIADAARRAVNNLRPAEIGYGTAQAPEHLNNRRWYLKPGTMPENPYGEIDQVKMNPSSGPNLVEPAGPTDPTISFLSVREPAADGRPARPIALYAAYGLHYVGGTGGGAISADYFAVFADEIQRLLKADRQDPPFVGMMANGTSGDVNNINFRQRGPSKKPYEQMRYVAGDVAAKVFAALDKVEYKSNVRLDARYREPTLKWRKPTPERLEWAKKRAAEGVKVTRGADLPYLYAQRAIKMNEYPETTTIPLQVLAIGDVTIGTMPCEVFTETGLEWRETSPIKPAFIVELAGGSYGYLPTPRQHRLGGYETWLGTNRLEIEASEKMMKELREMAEEIKAARQSAGKTSALEPALRDKCLAVLRAGLASEEFWPAMHAAEALTCAGLEKEVLAALAKRTAADDQQACGLAREAVRAGDKSKAADLLKILVKPGSNGHTHAAESLYKVSQVGDGNGLKAALAQDADLKLKLMAAAALARSGDASALDNIRSHLKHSDVEVRKAAVWILGKIGAPSDAAAVKQALAKETDPLAKAYFANALACLGDAEGKRLLSDNLQSSNPAIRTYSAEFAGYCRAHECREQLIKLLSDDTLDVRVRAAQSLIVLSQPAEKLGLPRALLSN